MLSCCFDLAVIIKFLLLSAIITRQATLLHHLLAKGILDTLKSVVGKGYDQHKKTKQKLNSGHQMRHVDYANSAIRLLERVAIARS